MDSQPQAASKTEELDYDIHAWIGSLDQLISAVEKSSMDVERKSELLMHMSLIRDELKSGQWPALGEASSMKQLTHEVGELDQLSQDWQTLSVRLAHWIKAISDSLGIR